MKPQSKITVFMVVMIVMLSIYYFAMDKDKVTKPTEPTDSTASVYEPFEAMREELSTNRETLISQLETVLVSKEVSAEEKNQAYETIKTINQMDSNEFNLETNVMSLGYMDVFVGSDDDSVQVQVLDSELSFEEANTIIVMAKTQFGKYHDVVVTYVTPEDNY